MAFSTHMKSLISLFYHRIKALLKETYYREKNKCQLYSSEKNSSIFGVIANAGQTDSDLTITCLTLQQIKDGF